MGRARQVTFAAAVATLALTAACGSPHAGSGAADTVAFVMANSQLSFAQEMALGFQAGVAAVGGVRAEVTGPGIVDGPREVQLFQAAMTTAPSGVSLFTLDSDLFSEPLGSAAKAGIPVIAVDNPLPVGTGATLFVGNDNLELGRKAADLVIARLPAEATGTVVIGSTAPGAPALDRRSDGMRLEFAARLPGVHVIGPFDTKQETSANLAAWRLLVRTNRHALAFLGTGDADGWNLATIHRTTHGRWLAAAFDLDPRALAAVRSGDLLLISPEHWVKGAVAGRLQALTAKTGAALPKGWVYTPELAVTPGNIDAIIARQATPQTRATALNAEVDKIM
jgi:ribose transport system substrate-binding protein